MNSVHLSGADELDKVLAMLPVEIARKELDKALLAGARVVAREMKLRAPVGEMEDTPERPPGFLRKNVRARVARPSEYGAIARLVGHNRFSAAAIAGVSAKAWYGRLIEWGFMLTSRTGTPIRFIGPRPFLRPAWDATKHIALDTVGTTLARGVEAAATRLTGRYRTSGFSKRGRTFIG